MEKKIMSLVLTLSMLTACVFVLTSCGRAVAYKAIKESELSMAGEDYEAALNYLELAKKEGSKNREVDTMISIIENYLTAKKELEAANMDGAIAALNAIPESYTEYVIANDVDKLRDEVNKKQATMVDIDSQISGTKKLIVVGDYASAEINIAELYSKNMTSYQKAQVDEMDTTVKTAKSKIGEAGNKTPSVVYVPQNPPTNPSSNASSQSVDSSIISNRSTSEIENYISSYVRPLYNEVQSNLSNYSSSSSGGVTYWSDEKGCIKKQFTAGTNNYNMSREYYYDTDSGRIAFAFVYSGTTEYRLYFRTNQLIRYIGPDGVAVNNPTSSDVLSMASRILNEAY